MTDLKERVARVLCELSECDVHDTSDRKLVIVDEHFEDYCPDAQQAMNVIADWLQGEHDAPLAIKHICKKVTYGSLAKQLRND